MYKVTEARIRQGLSLFPGILPGLVSGLFGAVLLFFGYAAFGLFCMLIALACWYLIYELSGGVLVSGSRSKPSILNAALFMSAFGIAGLSYAIYAKFGFKNREARQPIK